MERLEQQVDDVFFGECFKPVFLEAVSCGEDHSHWYLVFSPDSDVLVLQNKATKETLLSLGFFFLFLL